MGTAIGVGLAVFGGALLAGGAALVNVTGERIMQMQAGVFNDPLAVLQQYGGGW